MIKIHGGIYKNTTLLSPRNDRIRPVPAVMRSAAVNIARPTLQTQANPVVWDMFSGSAAMGMELASHGAAQVIFIESHPESLALIQDNIDLIGSKTTPLHPCSFLMMDCDAFQLKPKWWFHYSPHIIFSDPPFESTLSWIESFIQDLGLDSHPVRARDSPKNGSILLLVKIASSHLKDCTQIFKHNERSVKTHSYGSVSLLSSHI